MDCHCYTEAVDVGNVTFTTTTHPKLYLKALQVADTEDAARQVQVVELTVIAIQRANECWFLLRSIAHCT